MFSLEASDVSVDSSASDLNFFSGTCSVVWWAGALYFLSVPTAQGQTHTVNNNLTHTHTIRSIDSLSAGVCEWTWWLLTG